MAAVAAAGIGAVSLGAENLPQPVNAATNDVRARSSQDDLKTAQENAKTAEAAKRASCFDRGGSWFGGKEGSVVHCYGKSGRNSARFEPGKGPLGCLGSNTADGPDPTTPTEPTQPSTEPSTDPTTEPTTEPSKEPSTEPTAKEYTEEPADTEEDTDGGDVVTVVNTDEEPATKSAAKTPTLVTKLANTALVAKAPAATGAQLPQTGEKDAKPGILAGIISLLAGVSLFGFSFEKRKQEK